MTLRSASFVDGARIDAALLREEAYARSGGHPGVHGVSDMKVLPLVVPGHGFRVRGGVATVLNYYQGLGTNQAYVVTNIGEAIIDSLSGAPAANPAQRSYLVLVTVGDQEFSQAGHPWMPSTPISDVERETFQYNRFHVLQCPAGTESLEELNPAFPGYALARLDVPAGVAPGATGTTFVDLRDIPNGRTLTVTRSFGTSGATQRLTGLNGTPNEYQNFPNDALFSLKIPKWATRMHVDGWVEGLKKVAAGTAVFRIVVRGAGTSSVTNIDEDAPGGASDRFQVLVGGSLDIPPAIRGTTQTVKFDATPTTTASKGFLETHPTTGAFLRVTLEEKPV